MRFAMCLTVMAACGGGAETAVDGGAVDGRAVADGASVPAVDAAGVSFDPVDVTLELDSDRRVEAFVPLEGGTLRATAADGTVYALVIPANALVYETKISLTPVAKITGLPFGGQVTRAVQFGPEGLFLNAPAILTITPNETIPDAEQIFFGYAGEGKDVILEMPVMNSREIKIRLLHFSGYGVTRGLLASVDPVRERLGGSAERRLSSEMGEEATRERQRQLSGQSPTDLNAKFTEFYAKFEEQVIKPRVAAAGDSCAAGRLAIQTVLQFERQRQFVGSDGIEGDPLAGYPGLRDRAARVCVLEEFELCVKDHVIHRMASVWGGLVRENALLPGSYSDSVIAEARDLAVACLTFKLKFHSTGTLSAGGGWTSTVSSEITLRFNPEEGTLSGEAPMIVEHWETIPPGDCVATSIPSDGGTFKVFQLKVLTARPDSFQPGVPDVTGRKVGFEMIYFPGLTTEKATLTCKGASQPIPFSTSAWTPVFTTTHTAEFGTWEGYTGFLSIDWEVFYEELLARKEWSKAASYMVEAGSFDLHHTPGQ